MFTEKVSDFLARKPHLTTLGLAWALYWRFTVVTLLAYISFFFALAIIGAIIDLN